MKILSSDFIQVKVEESQGMLCVYENTDTTLLINKNLITEVEIKRSYQNIWKLEISFYNGKSRKLFGEEKIIKNLMKEIYSHSESD